MCVCECVSVRRRRRVVGWVRMCWFNRSRSRCIVGTPLLLLLLYACVCTTFFSVYTKFPWQHPYARERETCVTVCVRDNYIDAKGRLVGCEC